MNIQLHKNTTTTPARRAYIQAPKAWVKDLALELGVTEDSIRRWKKRDTLEDRSHINLAFKYISMHTTSHGKYRCKKTQFRSSAA